MPAKPARCQCCKSLSWVTQLWDSETQTQSRQRTLSGGVSKTTWGRYYMNFWVGVSRKDPKNPELVQLHQEPHLIQQKQGDGPPTKSFILPSSVLHHIRKPLPDQKPVIPVHSSKFKSPFHSSSQEPKKPIRPSLRRNGSKILGEKKKRSTQTKHPTFITLRAVVYIPSLPGKMNLAGLGIVQIFQNFYAWEIICVEFLRSFSDVIWRGNQW